MRLLLQNSSVVKLRRRERSCFPWIMFHVSQDKRWNLKLWLSTCDRQTHKGWHNYCALLWRQEKGCLEQKVETQPQPHPWPHPPVREDRPQEQLATPSQICLLKSEAISTHFKPEAEFSAGSESHPRHTLHLMPNTKRLHSPKSQEITCTIQEVTLYYIQFICAP